MPIDASIPLQARGPQFESPLNALAQALQVQGLQRQNELGGIQLQQTRQGIQEQNALRQLLGEQGFDISNPEFQRRAMAISPTGAQGLIKSRSEAMTSQANLQKTQLENMTKKAGMFRDALANVTNPQQGAQWIAAQYQDPDLVKLFRQPAEAAISSIPQDPAGFQQWIQKQALGMGKFIEQNAPKTTQVNTGGTVELVSTPGLGGKPTTLQSYTRTASPESQAMLEQARATRDAASMKRDQDTEMKLADDYRMQSKPFKEVSDAYRQISGTLDKATTSPAATLAAATKFMKLLDPGSVVRESELGMALAASGVIDRATNYFNVLQRGKVLTPTQAADFKRVTAEIYKAAQEAQQAIDSDYKNKASTYGLRSEMVTQDLGQNQRPQSAQPSTLSVIDFNSLP